MFAYIKTLLAIIGCCFASSAISQPTSTTIWLGQISSGQPSEETHVRSWKAMKFENVIRQRTDFSCGAAVLATVLDYAFGYHATEQQILVNMLKVADPDVVREKGFSLLDMKNYVKEVGLRGEGYKVDYASLAKLRVPAIVLLNIRGYKHFVILRRSDRDEVSIADPALGNRTMRRGGFESAWNGVLFVITGKGFNPDTVLLRPVQPLSAAQLYESRSPVTNAEPSEFGFGPSFIFNL